ncbi:MAG: hypothetical protein ABEI13_02715 [Candidatus Paceibacteria bacterium]
MPWDTHNVNTASKELYDEIMQRRPDLFPRQHILFQIAVAVGIQEDDQESLEGDSEALIKTSADAFDPDEVLKSLMEERYPDKEEKQQLEELEKFAESGIKTIHETVKRTGTFDIDSYVS